jgi:hypothetical protein
MKGILFAATLLGLSAALLAAQDTRVRQTNIQDARIEEVGQSPVEVKFAPGGKVRMDLCSSGIELIGSDDGVVRVSYEREAAVRVRLEVIGDEADLKVRGCPNNNFRLRIEVPKASALHIRMFAGELEVHDVTGDKNVELSFGQLNMEIGKPDDYAHVDASVSSGDLEARAFDVSKGGLFRSFDHSGPGKYRLHAHVGAGQLDLR